MEVASLTTHKKSIVGHIRGNGGFVYKVALNYQSFELSVGDISLPPSSDFDNILFCYMWPHKFIQTGTLRKC